MIGQLPTTVKRAEKYERTVGHETRQDEPFPLSLSLSLFSLSLPPRLTLAPCSPQIMLHNHKEKPCASETYLKQAGEEKNSKERITEGSTQAVGAWFLYICIKGQHGGELGTTVKTHKSRHLRPWLLHTCLHKLNQPGRRGSVHRPGSPTRFLYIFPRH